jgi:hypothetical protein
MTQHLGLLKGSCCFLTCDNHNTTADGNTRDVFLIAHCNYLQSTHGDLGMMQLSLFSSTIGQTSLGSGLYIYIFIDGGEVCGRYADDARLIHASVNAPTSVVGSHSKLPSSVIILINGQLFSLGSRVLHCDTKPCSFGTTQTFTPPF